MKISGKISILGTASVVLTAGVLLVILLVQKGVLRDQLDNQVRDQV